MNEQLQFRLQLLKDSGQIGNPVFEQVENLVAFLEKNTGVVLTEDNAAMLIMHFAIALERARRSELVGAMESATRTEIEASPHYERAVSFLERWVKEENIPAMYENERDFLLLHLCVLLGNATGKE